mgnify:CR=1 FL=1
MPLMPPRGRKIPARCTLPKAARYRPLACTVAGANIELLGGLQQGDEIAVSGTGEARVGSIGYENVSADVLGRFEDGSAAASIAALAFALALAPEQVWKPLTPEVRTRVAAWLQNINQVKLVSKAHLEIILAIIH